MIAAIGLTLAVGPVAFAQSSAVAAADANPRLQEFEVVSLKPSDPNVMHQVGVQLSPDRIAMNYETVKGLICVAYNIPYWELSGGEPWMEKEHYDLEAKPPVGEGIAPYSQLHANFEVKDERLREMMQAMLADRFHLKFHRETATGTVSILEQSGKPLLLVPSKLKYAGMYGEGYSEVGGAVEGKGVGLYNTSMPELAKFLSEALLHHPVIDKTGLDGRYDFRSATIVTKEDFESGSVMNLYLPAVNEMGLKLTQAKGPVETFVIDHAERPSANLRARTFAELSGLPQRLLLRMRFRAAAMRYLLLTCTSESSSSFPEKPWPQARASASTPSSFTK
jgi:uncharacterized protein (TIGR03435 family)